MSDWREPFRHGELVYDEPDGLIVCADCRDVLPRFPAKSIDLVLTDPPYPDYHTDKWTQTDIRLLSAVDARQIIFWSVRADFPLDYTAIHVWDKFPGGESSGVCGYERIFERNGFAQYRLFRGFCVTNEVRAMRSADVYTGHPSQKPIFLLKKLLHYSSKINHLVLDPFLGSGTTAVAAVQIGRKFIGIEISREYCELAADRVRAAKQGMKLTEYRQGQKGLF